LRTKQQVQKVKETHEVLKAKGETSAHRYFFHFFQAGNKYIPAPKQTVKDRINRGKGGWQREKTSSGSVPGPQMTLGRVGVKDLKRQ